MAQVTTVDVIARTLHEYHQTIDTLRAQLAHAQAEIEQLKASGPSGPGLHPEPDGARGGHTEAHSADHTVVREAEDPN